MSLFENNAAQALRKGLDAAWIRQQVSSHNIANSETPGFKAKTVRFEEIMQKAKEGTDEIGAQYKAVIGEDQSTAARPDGNNVSTEKEEMDLWEAYYQYSAMTKRMSANLSSLRYVINNTGK